MNEVLQKRIDDLKIGAAASFRLMQGGAGRWNKPGEDDEYDLLKEEESVPVFDREKLGQEYTEAIEDTKKDGGSRDMQIAKLQSDLLSSLQMGTVLRHRTRLVHFGAAVSRHRAHAQYVLERTLVRHISNLESAQ